MEKILERPASAAKNHKESYRSFLKEVPLFSDFPDRALDQVLANVHARSFHKDKFLFMIGDKADFFYVIINGWIKLFRETRDGHETVVAMLTVSDVFGRCAVLKNGAYPYSCQAATDAEVLTIPSNFMLYMAEHHTEFDHFLGRFLEGERSEFNQKGLEAEHLTHMPSAERVGCFLLRMCGEPREGTLTLRFPYEKSLVAGRLGMTPETFSRSLNQLTSLGVETKNSEVVIHNMEQLRMRVCEHCSATRQECPLGEEVDEVVV